MRDPTTPWFTLVSSADHNAPLYFSHFPVIARWSCTTLYLKASFPFVRGRLPMYGFSQICLESESGVPHVFSDTWQEQGGLIYRGLEQLQ